MNGPIDGAVAPTAAGKGRSVIICHAEDPLDLAGMTAWLGSFTQLVGVVIITEPPARKRRRVWREFRRVGPIRFLDVIAFRIWYRLTQAAADADWRDRRTEDLVRLADAADLTSTERLEVASPNAPAVEEFLRRLQPDLMLARCKSLLARRVYSIPRLGTFVLHPGICPEYRNAHGGFWALAEGKQDMVGVTLLRIDDGVDTGPVFGYFKITPRPLEESPFRMQWRALIDNLPAIQDLLERILRGGADPLPTVGRVSRAYGQPWLTAHLRVLRRWRNSK